MSKKICIYSLAYFGRVCYNIVVPERKEKSDGQGVKKV